MTDQKHKYKIIRHKSFNRHIELARKRNLNIDLFKEVVRILSDGETLPAKYKDHALKGDWAGHRECHITGDWLLIYKIDKGLLILELVDTGTHCDLF